jgi:alpha/beta superfamily hydrolase
MPSERVFFSNERNFQLAGILEVPEQPPRAMALFSHCFTCSKDLKAIVRISRGLAAAGIGVLRFDFTGLGNSEGDFSDTNFETNLADIFAATEWMKKRQTPPQILIGLSLGGAAMMAAAEKIESVQGIATLAAPSCTKHLAKFLTTQSPAIEAEGAGSVTIGGRSYTIKPQLLESLRNHDLGRDIAALTKHHLIIHSPLDETLGFYHAEEIFAATGGPKTFVTLDGANHLMVNQKSDVEYVADQIGLWSQRFI